MNPLVWGDENPRLEGVGCGGGELKSTLLAGAGSGEPKP
jgi:hypothetical protein